jgi:hypothetical protein
MKPKNNFKRNHLINLIIRFISKDNLYICEECHHIHKRDGREIRLDKGTGLMLHPLWYGSIKKQCFLNQQNKIKRFFRQAVWVGGFCDEIKID